MGKRFWPSRRSGGFLIAIALLFGACGSVGGAQEQSRGWGSSWTDPHTAEEKAARDLTRQFQQAARVGDFARADKVLAEGQRRYPKSVEVAFVRAMLAIARHRYNESLGQLDRTFRLLPKETPAQTKSGFYVLRSYVHQLNGDYRAGRADLENALRLNSRNPVARNNYAWLLATSPDARVRDGRRAVEIARGVNKETGSKVASLLDTLAAAEAETGDFRSAAKLEQKAVRLATSGRDTFQKHLHAFQRGQVLRVPPDPPRIAMTDSTNGNEAPNSR